MGDHEPCARIEKVEGKIETLKAKMEGEMKEQRRFIESIEGSCKRIEDSFTKFTERTSNHIGEIYEKGNVRENKITSLEKEVEAQKELNNVHDESLRKDLQNAGESFKKDLKNVETSLSTAITDGFRNMKTAQKAKKESRENWKSWVFFVIMAILAIIGWLV